ncbi:hypothetical protein H5410_004471, partial [Solanum commersonii]
MITFPLAALSHTRGNAERYSFCLTLFPHQESISLTFGGKYDNIISFFLKLIILFNGEEHQYRVFPWSIGYNPKEEMPLAVVWISLPKLSPYLFAKKSLLSIASAVGKPIAIDKATQIKSRPNTTRVKVILDLMEKLPNRIRLQFVDGKSSKLIKVFQEIVYDNLPLYCNYCKHQGHDEDSCRLISKRNQNNKQIDDTIKVSLKDAENSGQHVLQVENENPTKNWTLVAHKKSTSSRILFPTSQNNSPCSEKGPTGNFYDSEKRQDTSNASRDLLCSNNFDALLKTTGKQKSESRALVSNKIDLGEDSLDEDRVDLGEDSLDEDEEDNMLDICFDRVGREGDVSRRQQRSERNKSKNKTHGRQHSWDGKMTEEFDLRHLPMRQAKKNHLTVSIGSTRSNKSTKK